MDSNEFQFRVSSAVLELGVTAVYLLIEGMENRLQDGEFDAYKKSLFERLKLEYSDQFIKHDPIVGGFRELHTKIGYSNRKFVSSPENLANILLRQGSIPTINLIVDIYNCISLETRSALGSHDISKIDRYMFNKMK